MSNYLTLSYDVPEYFVGPQRIFQPIRLAIHVSRSLPAGSRLRVILGGFRSMLDNNPQHVSGQWREASCQVQGGAGRVSLRQGPPLGFTQLNTARLRDPDWPNCFVIALVEVEQAIAPGSVVVIQVRGLLSHQAPMTARLAVHACEPDGDFQPVGDIIALRNVPGPTDGIEARVKAWPDADGRHAVNVFGIDEVWNPAEPKLAWESLATQTRGPGEVKANTIACRSSDQPARLLVRDPRGYESLSNPVIADDFHGRRVCFGEFHFHSRFSGDGDRTIEQAYEYARDVLMLDFAGVTDHTPVAHWQETLRINEQFNEPGRFVTLPAWEWSTTTGHSNIYLRHPEVDAGPDQQGRQVDHPGRHDWPDDAVVVPHHTNIRSNNHKPDGSHYWYEFNWSLPNKRVRLVEIVQGRGNFEADQLDGDWGIVTGNIGASVHDALNMGYRIGFVGGTDNHCGFPTRDARMHIDIIGMACILVEQLTREHIWQAMNARRTYATTGKPIRCHWRVNGYDMGEEGVLESDKVTFTAHLHGTAPIERVEVMRNGRIVWRSRPDAYDAVFTDETLPPPPAEQPGGWYYLRLRQHDGHRAWLSPVWLDRPTM